MRTRKKRSALVLRKKTRQITRLRARFQTTDFRIFRSAREEGGRGTMHVHVFHELYHALTTSVVVVVVVVFPERFTISSSPPS